MRDKFNFPAGFKSKRKRKQTRNHMIKIQTLVKVKFYRGFKIEIIRNNHPHADWYEYRLFPITNIAKKMSKWREYINDPSSTKSKDYSYDLAIMKVNEILYPNWYVY